MGIMGSRGHRALPTKTYQVPTVPTRTQVPMDMAPPRRGLGESSNVTQTSVSTHQLLAQGKSLLS